MSTIQRAALNARRRLEGLPPLGDDVPVEGGDAITEPSPAEHGVLPRTWTAPTAGAAQRQWRGDDSGGASGGRGAGTAVTDTYPSYAAAVTTRVSPPSHARRDGLSVGVEGDGRNGTSPPPPSTAMTLSPTPPPNHSAAASTADAAAPTSRVRVGVRIRPFIHTETGEGSGRAWKVVVDDEGGGSTAVTGERLKRVVEQECEGDDLAAMSRGAQFRFAYAYGDGTTTDEVYSDLVHPIVAGVVNGFNGCSFAYGQTASGKTFTTLGNAEQRGLLIHAIDNLFHLIAARGEEAEYVVTATYLEIYQEVIGDLLNRNNVNLPVREDPVRGPMAAGATQRIVACPEDVLAVLAAGEANRHFGSTLMNERSSRSHTVFRLNVEQRRLGGEGEEGGSAGRRRRKPRMRRSSLPSTMGGAGGGGSDQEGEEGEGDEGGGAPMDRGGGGVGGGVVTARSRRASMGGGSPLFGGASSSALMGRTGSSGDVGGGELVSAAFVICDLAGSERVGKTGATGERLEEAKHINKSLHTLANVIASLALRSQGKRTSKPPFRDSKLTRLLQNALGGNSVTALVCCASPAARNREETRSTLEFATRAATIITHARVNVLKVDKDMIAAFKAEIDQLKRQLMDSQRMQNQLRTLLTGYETGAMPLPMAVTGGQGGAMAHPAATAAGMDGGAGPATTSADALMALHRVAELEAGHAQHRLATITEASRSHDGGSGTWKHGKGGGGGSERGAEARIFRALSRAGSFASRPTHASTTHTSSLLPVGGGGAGRPMPMSRGMSYTSRQFLNAINDLQGVDVPVPVTLLQSAPLPTADDSQSPMAVSGRDANEVEAAVSVADDDALDAHLLTGPAAGQGGAHHVATSLMSTADRRASLPTCTCRHTLASIRTRLNEEATLLCHRVAEGFPPLSHSGVDTSHSDTTWAKLQLQQTAQRLQALAEACGGGTSAPSEGADDGSAASGAGGGGMDAVTPHWGSMDVSVRGEARWCTSGAADPLALSDTIASLKRRHEGMTQALAALQDKHDGAVSENLVLRGELDVTRAEASRLRADVNELQVQLAQLRREADAAVAAADEGAAALMLGSRVAALTAALAEAEGAYHSIMGDATILPHGAGASAHGGSLRSSAPTIPSSHVDALDALSRHVMDVLASRSMLLSHHTALIQQRTHLLHQVELLTRERDDARMAARTATTSLHSSRLCVDGEALDVYEQHREMQARLDDARAALKALVEMVKPTHGVTTSPSRT